MLLLVVAVAQLNTLRVTRHVHSHLYMYKYRYTLHRVSGLRARPFSITPPCRQPYSIFGGFISVSGEWGFFLCHKLTMAIPLSQMQKLRVPVVGAEGCQRIPLSKPVVGSNIDLHALSAYKASFYLPIGSAFPAHSTSFSLNFFNPQGWNVYWIVN